MRRTRSGGCFICALPQEEYLYDDGEHIAFLSHYPTMPGYALVSPRKHLEHILRDLDPQAYLRLQAVVYKVAKAIEAVIPSERTYVLSLGSQQGNRHIHWHIAPLPPGTPPDEQQYHALMAENGVIPWSAEQAAELSAKIRAQLAIPD